MEGTGRVHMPPAMVWCERGIQVLLTTVGAFAAFTLMTVAIGTDYWLYARAFICNSTANSSNQDDPHNKDKKDPGALTHSGLWRICCLEGLKRGVCSQINHFPEDADYDQDAAEYLLRLSNIIGVIVYISAALSDISPKKDEDKKWHYSYGWSFYFGGLSFILAEVVGVLAVNIYIERNKELRCRSRTDLLRTTTSAMLRSSGGGGVGDISMYTLSRSEKPPMYGTVDRATLYQLHNYFPTGEKGADGSSGASVLMTGTLPSLSKSNLAASLQSATNTLNTLSSSGGGGGGGQCGGQQPPSSTATMERNRERGHGTLDRLDRKGDSSNSNTLNRRTTPV
ncbi:hypothetical protein AALO_G00253880 [Alosa alosa]|uniref:Uncharacterized protein n=1 Tax=Alosa alosa TaxID=278164 RepID=A0AAV6FT95_9TELE|nr:hypothetical protein AALO_G00253880 [Alosa alosa]